MMPGRLHLLFGLLALSMVLASAPSVRADDEDAEMLKAFRAAEKRIDNLYTKCDECKGTGKGELWEEKSVKGAKPPKCLKCGGARRVLRDGCYQDFLDQYLAYCELIEEYRSALAQPKNEKLNMQVSGRRSKYAAFIRRRLGVKEFVIFLRPKGGGEARPVRRVHNDPYTILACELILLKNSPVWNAIAFEADVIRVVEYDGERVAEVEVVNAKVPQVTCYVEVPGGARWVEGTKVRVIGRTVSPRKLETDPAFGAKPDPVLVEAYPGTE